MSEPNATVISVLNPKGGVGKSTISINVARALQLAGATAVIIDTDPQGTSLAWYEDRNPETYERAVSNRYGDDVDVPDLPEVVGVEARWDPDDLSNEIHRHEATRDYIIVDGSAKTDGSLGRSVAESDLVLIPMAASMADVNATMGFMDVIEEAQRQLGGIPIARGITNRLTPGTKEEDYIHQAFESMGLPELKDEEGEPTRIYRRVSYERSLGDGLTVFEGWIGFEGRWGHDDKSEGEIDRLTHSILRTLDHEPKKSTHA